MKSLLLLRHAKSSWKEGELLDHDRPLKKRGERDAPKMGKLIAELGLVPQLILSSTALRARATADAAAEAAGVSAAVHLEPAIYDAAPERLIEVIRGLDDTLQRVMLVGHNPGLEELVHQLTWKNERVTTGALVHLELKIDRWSELGPESKVKLGGIWRPKEI